MLFQIRSRLGRALLFGFAAGLAYAFSFEILWVFMHRTFPSVAGEFEVRAAERVGQSFWLGMSLLFAAVGYGLDMFGTKVWLVALLLFDALGLYACLAQHHKLFEAQLLYPEIVFVLVALLAINVAPHATRPETKRAAGCNLPDLTR